MFAETDFPPLQPVERQPPASHFPPAEKFTDLSQQFHHMPKIPTPHDVGPTGTRKMLSSPELVLNWQSENALAQNAVLQRLDKSTAHTRRMLEDMQERLHKIETGLIPKQHYLEDQTQEITKLKNQIRMLEDQLAKNDPASTEDFLFGRSRPYGSGSSSLSRPHLTLFTPPSSPYPSLSERTA